jgi:hypothetical protein
MQSQRIRMPSAKAIANKALRAFDGDEILLEFDISIERQPRRPPRVQSPSPPPPASTSAAAANQSASKVKKSYKKKRTKASRTPSTLSIPPSKFRSILSENRFARELRQNSKITLIPLLIKEYILWENDLLYPKEISPPQSIIRQKAEKKETEISLYINKEIPPASPESKPESSENYYLYPKFFSISRINHAARVNFPKNFISLIKFFKQFFSREQMKNFVIIINKYAKQEIQRKQIEENTKFLIFNKRCAANRKSKNFLFKLIIIKKIYVFLGILTYINFEKISKFRDY